ncbi:methylmalonyl Co-A mutase-associated GTPase MeaB [Rhodoflexus caldus]|uniref:methylmalonyl Co-A mutase-associated GTPase MeaB n=1 Tax=Rhodoflexus caldus TaxID=2891236 RepID=UPI002029E7B6|nr:methylmalonyl Co-A mutase-associated GTPase MeaB [Rhodoflexus caldus]
MPRPRLSTADYINGIREGNRFVLSRAITLIESRLPADREQADAIIQTLLPESGKSIRIGITGVPGVGKSTFIERFGMLVTDYGKKLAVLAIDPSSPVTGGSIMGDKTRMEQLSHNPMAYIRPSPSGSSLGGVSRKTRETMLLCEAAGFEVIFVETVGVGQSETAVHSMTDFFLLLMLAGAGDELQGIKKGIMEMADAVAINKADGDNIKRAKIAQAEYRNALHFFPPKPYGWQPKVLTCSALEGNGLEDIWQMMQDYRRLTESNGWWERKRMQQQEAWLKELIAEQLLENFYGNMMVKTALQDKLAAIQAGRQHVPHAVADLMNLYREAQKHS